MIYYKSDLYIWALSNGGVHVVAEQSSYFCKFYDRETWQWRVNVVYTKKNIIK